MDILRASWTTAALWLAPVVALAATPQFVNSRQVTLEYRLAEPVAVDDVLVWVSADGGRTWRTADVTREGQAHVGYTAPADGRYDFYLVLRNAAGASADAPQPGSRPTATIIVDTLAPLIQIHDAEIERAADALQISFRATLIEENLSPAGVHLFYRCAGEKWLDGGDATVFDDRIRGALPGCAAEAADVRVVAVDLAGNVASAELLRVSIPAREAPVEPASQPAEPPPPSESPPSASVATDAEQLRKRAAEYMAEGRFSLATARLEDALAASPDDADLLVELGTAFYRAGRYDDAASRLQAALHAQPNHAGALDGLALVAATQRQYPQAREHLLALQRLRPESGVVWLRSGDIEHRLGNLGPALAAWRQVLRVSEADESVRDGARRRLAYFGGQSAATQPVTGEAWQERSHLQSSSSAEMTSIKRPPR